MINIVLVEPEIPQNTGNIVRTCAATGCRLHLVKPLGFDVSEKAVKRAGLDYWHLCDITYYENLNEFLSVNAGKPMLFATTKGKKRYDLADYPDGIFILFGKETKGLPEELLAKNYDRCIRLPMLENLRSLNLSNSVAIIAYEALRHAGFEGMETEGNLHHIKL